MRRCAPPHVVRPGGMVRLVVDPYMSLMGDYDNKICTGEESAQCRGCLDMRMESIGYRTVTDRGDAIRET